MIALARASGMEARYNHGTCYFILSKKNIGHVWSEINVGGKWYIADSTSSRNDFGVVRSWRLVSL